MSRKVTVLLLCILILVNGSACGKKTSRYEAEFLRLFDTLTKIVAYSDSEADFTKHAQLIHDSLEEYHKLYDIYNEYEGINNLKTINDNAGIAPVKVDRRIIDLIGFSIDWYEKTDGKVNIAFGSVLKLWHDCREAAGEDPEQAQLPQWDQLLEAAEHTDIYKIVVNEEESTVYLEDPEMRLDVGAIAKGYATEEVSRIARENGFTSGLISVGGNVRAISGKVISDVKGNSKSGKAAGNRGDGSKGDSSTGTGMVPWVVGIQNPDQESDNKQVLNIDLTDASLVTSGIYERFYSVDGKNYHHIIDPETLYPAEYFMSVSIVCRDSSVADTLSTAIFNMPLEQGLEFINGLPDTEALWVLKNGELKFSEHFKDFLIDTKN